MMYLFQVTVYTGLMLLLYMLLLRNRPNHSFNRAYLLLAGVIPIMLPFIKLPTSILPTQEVPAFSTYLNEVTVGGAETTQILDIPLWFAAAIGIYITMVLTLLVIRFASFLKIKRIIRRSPKESMGSYYLLKNTGYGPGSWYNYIFLPEQDVDNNIIKHEQVHIELKHSRDLLFINILQTFLWPNLFIHFIKKELIQIHEFQADAAVGEDKEIYSKLLLSSVLDTEHLPLAHSFINHPIKRRIMMLYKNQTTGRFRGILASILSVILLAGIITMQSCEQKQDQVVKPLDGHKDFEKITKMPQTEYDLYEYLGKAIKYPAAAKEKGIEGRIVVKFVIDSDGTIKDAEISNKEYDEELGKTALAVVNNMPAWVPGEVDGEPVPVYYQLPIMFKLSDKDKETNNPPPPPPPPTAHYMQDGPLDISLFIYTAVGSRYESLSDEVKAESKIVKEILENIEKRFTVLS